MAGRRPKESIDQMIKALAVHTASVGTRSSRHEWTMKFVRHRVADHRILRLIQKWLKAGVSEDGQWSETKVGTPQGAVVTPLTQKVTSSLSGGCGFGGNRVRIDRCRIWFYLYDRCRAPAMFKGLNGSIGLANCCGSSRNVPRPSPS